MKDQPLLNSVNENEINEYHILWYVIHHNIQEFEKIKNFTNNAKKLIVQREQIHNEVQRFY
jgi:hypothetical protein